MLFNRERTKAKMVDKSEILRQMRKYAQSFSSALTPPKVVDEANIKHALGLIDVTAKDSRFGKIRKLSFKNQINFILKLTGKTYSIQRFLMYLSKPVE